MRDRLTRFNQEAMVHLEALMQFARRLTGKELEAEDLVQECLEKAFRGFHQFRSGTNCRAWLFTILHNCLRQKIRWNSIRPKEVAESDLLHQQSDPEPESDPQYALSSQIPNETVLRALDRLGQETRAALLLSAVEGFSYEEIAGILKVPLGTVRSRIHRARKQLFCELAQNQGVPYASCSL